MEMEYTLVILRPSTLKMGVEDCIRDRILELGLTIEMEEKTLLTEEFISEHYKHLINDPKRPTAYPETLAEMTSGDSIGMIVVGKDAISKVRELAGPTKPSDAREKAPNSLRALYGHPEYISQNVLHCSDSKESAAEEVERFFGSTYEELMNHGKGYTR